MRKHTRPGIALIEALLMIAALGLIIALSTSILVSTVRTSRNAEKTLHRLTTRSQLADRFRADVAAASLADVGAEGLKLRIGDHEVVYAWTEDILERTEKQGDEVSRQQFGKGLQCDSVEFRKSRKTADVVVVMRLRSPVGERKDAAVTEIAAALQGDGR
jgi:hypothetical protein